MPGAVLGAGDTVRAVPAIYDAQSALEASRHINRKM